MTSDTSLVHRVRPVVPEQMDSIPNNGKSPLQKSGGMRVLMITSEWPSSERPSAVPFIVRQVEFLRCAGIHVEVFHFRGARKPSNYVQAWRRVQSQLLKRSYDLVHAQWGQSAFLALPKKRPLVVTFRGDDLQGIVGDNGHYTIAGRVLRTGSKCVAHLADEVIVVSEKLARNLPKRAYHVIPSGLDLRHFHPMSQRQTRQQLCLPSDKKLVLFAANLGNAVKRYNLAQEAVRAIDGRFNVELIVAKGVPYNLMPLYMNACDVLLMTSLHEGSPNVVKEALACNLPVVSVDVGDVRERISSINGCVLCEDDHPETIAKGLIEILKRKERIDGRSTICDLDESHIAQKIISVYKRATAR